MRHIEPPYPKRPGSSFGVPHGHFGIACMCIYIYTRIFIRLCVVIQTIVRRTMPRTAIRITAVMMVLMVIGKQRSLTRRIEVIT